MKNFSLFIFLLFQIQFLFAQSNYRISIRVVNEDTQQGIPYLGVNLIENGRGIGSGTTDGNGIAKFDIPRTTRNITLGFTSKDIEIKYPIGGKTHAPSPEVNDPSVEFLVKTSSLRLKTLAIDHLTQELEKLQARVASDQILFKDSIDKIHIQIDSLHNAISNKKLAVYSEISDNYFKFLNAILDMEVALENVSPAFTQEGELRIFNQQIEILNQARNSLHENHLAYLEAVENHWGKETALHLKGLYKQALENIYGDIILPLNDELISKLKDTWNGNKPRLFVQRKAVKNTNKALSELRQEISTLKAKADIVLPLLESGIEET